MAVGDEALYGSGRLVVSARASCSRSGHTKTGLLIGSLVGSAATTLFGVGFCGDPDRHPSVRRASACR
jgi:hypothetical protein